MKVELLLPVPCRLSGLAGLDPVAQRVWGILVSEACLSAIQHEMAAVRAARDQGRVPKADVCVVVALHLCMCACAGGPVSPADSTAVWHACSWQCVLCEACALLVSARPPTICCPSAVCHVCFRPVATHCCLILACGLCSSPWISLVAWTPSACLVSGTSKKTTSRTVQRRLGCGSCTASSCSSNRSALHSLGGNLRMADRRPPASWMRFFCRGLAQLTKVHPCPLF